MEAEGAAPLTPLPPPRRSAASALAGPLPLAAVALLVVNDHWAKRAYPGWLTGKLSDVAGMVFFPLLLGALAEGALALFGTRPPLRRTLAAACLATALAFALAKTTEAGNAAYRVGLGYAQWPFYALGAAARGRPAPPPRPVVLVRDPSDLIALPFVGLAYALGARPGGGRARRKGERAGATLA
ncbi:MAG TPA: hypothetical protein VFS43_06765 [Polyangiaceae bacterium]|nr:hypothetical protein [Polyangiaceae bacterium]